MMHRTVEARRLAEGRRAPPSGDEPARPEGIRRLLHSGYRSEQPVHPNRGFGGREQVEKNWSALFDGIPDFHAELIATAAAGDALWSEWHWTGTRVGEAPLDMRGVTLFRVEDGRLASGRLYMEEVEEAGGDIDATVRRLAKGLQRKASDFA